MRSRIWLLGALGLLACDAGTPSDSATGGTNDDGTAGGGGEGASSAGGGGVGGGSSDPCDAVDCPAGEICDAGECIPGCDTAQDCAAGLSCCAGGCVDVATNVNHCGQCEEPCQQAPNTVVTCDVGICQNGGCADGFTECNGDVEDGCESSTPCSCTPGEDQTCYEGPAGTLGNGICSAGLRTCNQAGTAWGLCFDWQGPSPELCSNGEDEDCSGNADDVPDLDGDGWTSCDNDCCENTQDCSAPALVNPGAFEFVGNGVDDDCDAASSDSVAAPGCSTNATFSNVSPTFMAQAIDLCQFTTANPPLPQRKWGVVTAEYRLANGNAPSATQLGNMQSFQGAVLQNYGTGGIVPQQGATMAGISTGRMRDMNDTAYVAPNDYDGISGGTSFSTANQGGPAAYIAANGGNLPSSASCFGNCPAGTPAFDSINLRLSIRVPTNALSFSYDFRFFSAEYWQYSCEIYNDFYLALLTTGAAGIPLDKNISFDSQNNAVSVNNGFFDHCQVKGCSSCPLGSGVLAGTGMNLVVNDVPSGPDGMTGGGTTWLQTTAPVVPGETMILELMIFDVSDSVLDSLTLLDAFEWSVQPSGVGTGPAG